MWWIPCSSIDIDCDVGNEELDHDLIDGTWNQLVTYFGEPIEYDPSHTVESLARLGAQRMEALIEEHQPRPGNIVRAIRERFPPFSPTKDQ